MGKIVFSWDDYLRREVSLFEEVESAPIPALLKHIYPGALLERLPPPLRPACTSIAEKLRAQHGNFYSEEAIDQLYRKESLSVKTKRMAKLIENSLRRLLEPGGYHAFFTEQMIPAVIEFFVDLLKTPVTTVVSPDLTVLRHSSDEIFERTSSELRSEVEASHSKFLFHYILSYLRKIVERYEIDGICELRLRPKEAVIASFSRSKIEGLFSPLVTSPKVSDFEINDEQCLVLQSIVCLPQELAQNILGARVFDALNESSKARILEMTQTFMGKHRKICVDMGPSLKTIKNDSRPPKSLSEDICRLFSKLAAAFYLSFPGLYTRVNLEALYRHFIPKLPMKRFVSNEEFLENATIEFDTDPLRFIEDLGSHLSSGHEARLAEFKKALFNNTMFFYFHYATHWFRRLGHVIRISGTNGPLYSLEWKSVEERKGLLEKSSNWAMDSVAVREEWLRMQKKNTTRDSDGSFKAPEAASQVSSAPVLPQKEVQVEVSRAIEVTVEEEASGDAQKKKKLRQLGDSAESASTPPKVKDVKKIVKKSKDIKKADADADGSSRSSEELSQETSSAAFVKERTLYGNPKAIEPMEDRETASGEGAETSTKKSRKRQRSMDSDEVANETSRVEETEESQGRVDDLYSPFVNSPKITDFDIDDERCLIFRIINCTPQEVAEKIFGERILAVIDEPSSKALVQEMATKFIKRHRKVCTKMAPWLNPGKSVEPKMLPQKNLTEHINCLASKLAAALYMSFPGLYTRFNLEAAQRHFVSKLPLKHYVSTADLLESVDFEVKPLPFIDHLGSHIRSSHENRLPDFQQALFLNSMYFYFHYATHWFRRIASYDVANYSCDCRYYLEWRSVEERKRLLETSAYWAKENAGEIATKKQEKTRKHQVSTDSDEDMSETSKVEDTEVVHDSVDDLYSLLVRPPRITDFYDNSERCLVFQIIHCSSREVAEKIFGEKVFAAIKPSSKAIALEMTMNFIQRHWKVCTEMAPRLDPDESLKPKELPQKSLAEDINSLAKKLSAALWQNFPGLYARVNLKVAHRLSVSKLPLRGPVTKKQLLDSIAIDFIPDHLLFIEDLGSHIRSGHKSRLADFQQALLYNSVYFYFRYAADWFRRIVRYHIDDFRGCQLFLTWRSEEGRRLLDISAHWVKESEAVWQEKRRKYLKEQGQGNMAAEDSMATKDELTGGEGTKTATKKSKKRQRSKDSDEVESETSRVEEMEKGRGDREDLYSPLVTSPKMTDFDIDDERCLVFQIINCTPQKVAKKIFGEKVFAAMKPSSKAAVLEMTTKLIEKHQKLCVDLALLLNRRKTRKRKRLRWKNLNMDITNLSVKVSAALFTGFPGLYTESSLYGPRIDFVRMLPLKHVASMEQIFDKFDVEFDPELVPFIQDLGSHIRPFFRNRIKDFQQALFCNSMHFFFHYAIHWFRRIARVIQFTDFNITRYILERRSEKEEKKLLEKSAYWAMNRTAVREEWLRMQREKHTNKDSKVRRSISATEEISQGPSTSVFPRRKVSAEDLKMTEGNEVEHRKSRKRQRSNDSEEREIEDTEEVVENAKKRKRVHSDSDGARSITTTHEPDEYETPRAKSERRKHDMSMDSEASANGTPTVQESRKWKRRRKKKKRQSESDLEIIEVVSAEEAIERKRKKPCEVVELSSDERGGASDAGRRRLGGEVDVGGGSFGQGQGRARGGPAHAESAAGKQPSPEIPVKSPGILGDSW